MVKIMVGSKIVAVEMLSKKDASAECWDDSGEKSAVLVLDDGSRIYASQDYEGNNSGALFGREGDECFTIFVEKGGN